MQIDLSKARGSQNKSRPGATSPHRGVGGQSMTEYEQKHGDLLRHMAGELYDMAKHSGGQARTDYKREADAITAALDELARLREALAERDELLDMTLAALKPGVTQAHRNIARGMVSHAREQHRKEASDVR